MTHDASGTTPPLEQTDPRFWAEFDGAYRALLASLRVQADGAREGHARGAMKIRTRDALVLANGIAGLLFYFQQARAAAPQPAVGTQPDVAPP